MPPQAWTLGSARSCSGAAGEAGVSLPVGSTVTVTLYFTSSSDFCSLPRHRIHPNLPHWHQIKQLRRAVTLCKQAFLSDMLPLAARGQETPIL